MDSKWNEFQFYEEKKLFSRFSDFVFSWLGKFELDLDDMKITENRNKCKFEFAGLTSSDLASRHRQVATFVAAQVFAFREALGVPGFQGVLGSEGQQGRSILLPILPRRDQRRACDEEWRQLLRNRGLRPVKHRRAVPRQHPKKIQAERHPVD